MFFGVLKFFIALSFVSSYKMWAVGYEHDSSTAWSLFVRPPRSDGQDDSDTWLNGYSPQPPVYDQDPLQKWLYGPLLTQMPTEDSVKTPVKTFENKVKRVKFDTQPVSVPDVTTESVSYDDEEEEYVPYAERNIKYPF